MVMLVHLLQFPTISHQKRKMVTPVKSLPSHDAQHKKDTGVFSCTLEAPDFFRNEQMRLIHFKYKNLFHNQLNLVSATQYKYLLAKNTTVSPTK